MRLNLIDEHIQFTCPKFLLLFLDFIQKIFYVLKHLIVRISYFVQFCICLYFYRMRKIFSVKLLHFFTEH